MSITADEQLEIAGVIPSDAPRRRNRLHGWRVPELLSLAWLVALVVGMFVLPPLLGLHPQTPSVEVAAKLPVEEHISVFLPCAPNPTTGFFFYVPKSKIIEIEMSAEDAATLIMSAGVVQPGSDPQRKIAALAETANAARVANTAALNAATAKAE